MMTHKSHQEAVEDVLASIREIIEHDVEQDTKDHKIINLERHATHRNAERLVKQYGRNDATLPEEEVFNLTEMLTDTGEIIVLGEGESGMAEEQQEQTTMRKGSPIVSADEDVEDIIELTTLAPTAPDQSVLASASEKDAQSLLSQQAAAETAAAFSDLMAASAALSPAAAKGSEIGQTSVENLVQAAVRPLLKEWLDAHLPALVKQIVTEEIQKMRQG